MEKEFASLAAASMVRLCFDKLESSGWSGRLYTRFKAAPASFNSEWQLLAFLEQFYNYLDYPQASVKSHSFNGPGIGDKKAAEPYYRRRQRGELVEVESIKEMEKRHGEKATFIVRIQYRQNATWQGEVTWAEKDKTQSFRSALELLKLIDSTEKETREMEWDS